MSELNKKINNLNIVEGVDNSDVFQSESNINIEENENTEDNSNEARMPSTTDVLTCTLNNFQSSFSSIYQSLALNLNQSMNMVIGMNKLMDNLLLNSLKSSINIRSNIDKAIELNINLINIGKFPLPGLTYSIGLKPKNMSEEEEFKFSEYLSTNSDLKLSRCKNLTENNSKFEDFKPGQVYEEVIKFNPIEKTQYIGELYIEFLNPGTLTPLSITNHFGIYLIDFCELTHSQLSAPVKLENYMEISLNPQFLRNQFKLSPIDGIVPNLTQFNLSLPSNGNEISIYLIDPATDLCYLTYEEGADKGMIDNLVWELNTLNSQ